MIEADWERVYREEAVVLGQLGQVLVRGELPLVSVRLPADLARKAVASWDRDDDHDGDLAHESCEERLRRHRAGTLAVIGLTIAEHGEWDGDYVTVALNPVLIGSAVDAADDILR